MIKILFICHGNICRSPMAEFILKDMAEKAGMSHELEIASAATSAEELGNPVYPPAARKLREHGIAPSGKTARRLNRKDGEYYDLLICMDRRNVINAGRIIGDSAGGKLSLLMDWADGGEVADPWYTGDFDRAWSDISAGCAALLRRLEGGEYEPGT